MKYTLYGDPVLRKRAAPVEKITDELRTFLNEFAAYAVSLDAYGMAAPQVGRSIAVIVLRIPKYDSEGKLVGFDPPRIVINPKISNPSKETWSYPEGNYVLPHIQAEVYRPFSITLKGQNIDGTEFEEVLTGMPARIAMHENDHLHGVLFIDRLSAKDRKAIEPKLREIKNSLYKQLQLKSCLEM